VVFNDNTFIKLMLFVNMSGIFLWRHQIDSSNAYVAFTAVIIAIIGVVILTMIVTIIIIIIIEVCGLNRRYFGVTAGIDWSRLHNMR